MLSGGIRCHPAPPANHRTSEGGEQGPGGAFTKQILLFHTHAQVCRSHACCCCHTDMLLFPSRCLICGSSTSLPYHTFQWLRMRYTSRGHPTWVVWELVRQYSFHCMPRLQHQLLLEPLRSLQSPRYVPTDLRAMHRTYQLSLCAGPSSHVVDSPAPWVVDLPSVR